MRRQRMGAGLGAFGYQGHMPPASPPPLDACQTSIQINLGFVDGDNITIGTPTLVIDNAVDICDHILEAAQNACDIVTLKFKQRQVGDKESPPPSK